MNPIPPHTRAYIERCSDDNEPPDRSRIAAETGAGPEYVLSVICRVICERHGFTGAPAWREHCPAPYVRKRPKARSNLKACTCGRADHAARCPVRLREKARAYAAKAG